MRKHLLYVVAMLAFVLAGCEKNDPASRVSIWDGSVTMPADLETLGKKTPRLTDESGVKYAVVRINSASELAWLRNAGFDYSYDLHMEYGPVKFVLTTDIDLGGRPWVPIGGDKDAFILLFDGQGHRIKNLNVSGYDNAGLFSMIATEIHYSSGNPIFNAYPAMICNLHIESGTVTGNKNAGGICGSVFKIYNTKIVNCSNGATVTALAADGYAGGIMGDARGLDFDQCSNSGNVTGAYAGGIAAYSKIVMNSENSGAVAGTEHAGGIAGDGFAICCKNRGAVSGGDAGGIAGYCGSNYMSACYNTGTVAGTRTAGGICGSSAGSYKGYIYECYNTGLISGPCAGAICGKVSEIHALHCFWTASTPGAFGEQTGITGRGNFTMSQDHWPASQQDEDILSPAEKVYTWTVRPEFESGAWKSLGGWNGGKPVYPKLWWEK